MKRSRKTKVNRSQQEATTTNNDNNNNCNNNYNGKNVKSKSSKQISVYN